MVNPKTLKESTQLTAAAATQYTCPANIACIIKKLTLVNADAVNGHVVTIYIVPSGGAPGLTNLLMNQKSVGPNETVDVTQAVNQILAGGDFISAFAEVTGQVAIRISGVEIS